MEQEQHRTAYFHLPGLFEFYEFYRRFLPLFFAHRECFFDWCSIGSIYGAPENCIWGGGRIESSACDVTKALTLLQEYGISARLTFSNSLLRQEHLSDSVCNRICSQLEQSSSVKNGIIVHSNLLLNYLKTRYPKLYFVSSTTKVLPDFQQLLFELNREEFLYVVPDFRLNRRFDAWNTLTSAQKDKVEFLCNECCWFGCSERRRCYEAVSRKALDESGPEHICTAPDAAEGYRFSKAMTNPGFISMDDIHTIYLPMGFSQFKIEGRGLGSALLLEFILHYMTKPAYQLFVREELYLDNTLDLF